MDDVADSHFIGERFVNLRDGRGRNMNIISMIRDTNGRPVALIRKIDSKQPFVPVKYETINWDNVISLED